MITLTSRGRALALLAVIIAGVLLGLALPTMPWAGVRVP